MARRRQNKQRQTRLNFTSLPSSSPARNSYSSTVQSGLASVRYQSSSHSARTIPRLTSEDLKEMDRDSVDPAPLESEPNMADSSSDQEVTLIPQVKSRTSRSDGSKSLPTPVKSSQQKESYQIKQKDEQSRASRFWEDSDSDVFPAPASRRRRVTVTANDTESVDDTASQSTSKDTVRNTTPDVRTPSRRLARGTYSSPKVAGRRRSLSSQQTFTSSPSSTRRDTLRSQNKVADCTSRYRQRTHNPDYELADSDSSNNDLPVTTGTKPKARSTPRKQRFVVDDDDLEEVESKFEDDIIESPSKKRRTNPKFESPKKLSQTPKKRLTRRFTQEEKEEIDADVDDLLLSESEVLEKGPRDVKKSEKQIAKDKALAKIRRKKSGLPEDSESEEIKYYDAEPRGRVSWNGGDDDNNDANSFDEITDPEQNENLDEYDNDFVEEDDPNEQIDLSGMPLEYTHLNRMNAHELFPYIVEWMVNNKVNESFARDDRVYMLAFNKADDEAKGLAGQISSSSWGPHPRGLLFSKALKNRPNIIITPTEGLYLDEHCNACNRSNHPARYTITFDGPLYYRENLELKEGSDEETTDGGAIPDKETPFYVGSTCTYNAEKVHNLHHWRYHLNEWINDWLEAEGYLTNDNIVERSRMSKKKRTEMADEIVERMKAEKETDSLWRDLKNSIKEARAANRDTSYYIQD